MGDDRRSASRVRISGVRITYESASGERIDADAFDLGIGGAFVRTATPLAVGKRISLEIQVIGQPGPWAAIGRVVWTRQKGEGDAAPPGMGIKLIDADDAVFAGLERLTELRERTEPGVGKPSSAPPPVSPAPSITAPPARAHAPVVVLPPEREMTLLGVGSSEDATPAPPMAAPPAREGSVPIDLRSRKPAAARTDGAIPAASSEPAHATSPPTPTATAANERTKPTEIKRSSGRWIAILVLLVVAGVAAYVLVTGVTKLPLR
jgi:uncharacterized protein (TIGR02266 family)